jgi:hypothetical protein
VDQLVEQLKKSSETEAQLQQTQTALRLHNAQLIAAKAPTFWDMVGNRVGVICDELKQAFPTDNRYHLFVVQQAPNGWFLNGNASPRCILSAQLNIRGQQVDMTERIVQNVFDSPTSNIKAPITITVGVNEQLVFNFQGESFDMPDELARAIVSYVLRFSKVSVRTTVR